MKKQTQRRRRFWPAALLLAGLLLAGGCGNGKTKSGAQAGGEVQEDTGEPLVFATWSDEETYARKAVDAYNALRGKEEIILEIIPNEEHEMWIEQYSDAYGVDIVGLRGNSNLLKLQRQGKLAGLGRLLKDSGLDVTAYGTMFNEITIDGEYYALPARSTCWALYYNKEIFEELKLPYPKQMTWESYLELAGQISAENGKMGGYYPPWIFHIPAIQQGYYLLDDDLEAVRESLDFMERLYNSGSHVAYETVLVRSDYCCDDFEEGDIAMMINGEWAANMILEDEAMGASVPEWGIAPLPVPEGVEDGTTIGMYQFAGITSRCAYPERAFEFLQFLCGPQGARIYAQNAIIPGYCDDEIEEIYVEEVGSEQAEVFFEAKRVQEQPMWYGYDQLVTMFLEDAKEFLGGARTLDETMQLFEEQRRKSLG